MANPPNRTTAEYISRVIVLYENIGLINWSRNRSSSPPKTTSPVEKKPVVAKVESKPVPLPPAPKPQKTTSPVEKKPVVAKKIPKIKPFLKKQVNRVYRLSSTKAYRFLFGVPFGDKFVPLRIMGHHAADRYDPHNALIAILYRTGLTGLILFLWIITRELKRAVIEARKTNWAEKKCAIFAVITSLSYHILHSLTDVTLSNPFRGGIFWLLLGLLMVIRRLPTSDDVL
jgi:hypothetical protein